MIYTIIFSFLSAWYDKGKAIENHAPRFIFRALIVFIISYFTRSLWVNISVFYLTFDLFYNLWNGDKWNYIGTTAYIDKFWDPIGWKWQYAFKILFFITTLNI